MNSIYDVRDYIEEFVSRYETLLKGALRFFLALISLSVVNSRLGYMERLDSTGIVLAVSLLCSLLPSGLIIFFSAVFVILHCYALSLEAAIIVTALFLLMFLLYFRFTPRDTMAVLLTPLSFFVGMPYVMPVIYGLIGSPLSALSVGFGVASYFTVNYISESAEEIKAMSDATTVEKFRAILDGVLKNDKMTVYIISFAFTVVVVNIIKRFSVKQSWNVAILAGLATNMILTVIVGARLGADINIAGLILGSLIALIVAAIFKLFVFSVDYAKTERVQFEDDSYFYYVKAVPKIKTHKRRKTGQPKPDDDFIFTEE
jgi:hypothetical protein